MIPRMYIKPITSLFRRNNLESNNTPKLGTPKQLQCACRAIAAHRLPVLVYTKAEYIPKI